MSIGQVPLQTPWGTAQDTTEYADGIAFVSTASHGGFYLSFERARQIDPAYRDFAAKWSKGWGDQWYEEDCAALAVVITWPTLFNVNPLDVSNYKAVLDNYVRSADNAV